MFDRVIISRVNQFSKKHIGGNVFLGNNWVTFLKCQLEKDI